MTDITHTPTPWKVANGSDRLVYGGSDGERWVASTIGRDAQGAVDAAHIVRCVNCHDELVAAVRQLLANSQMDGHSYRDCHQKAEAILAKAEAA